MDLNVKHYFALPFSCLEVVVTWDRTAGKWRATDNGMATASWLTAYDQWPENSREIIGACGVVCCQDEFSAFGSRADQAARQLIAALLYLDEVRQRNRGDYRGLVIYDALVTRL